MYTLGVRDHFMIAHSFRGEVFGPAQRLHGATYVVDAEFGRDNLDKDGLIVDIGQASELLKSVLAGLNYRNLDQVPEFEGQNTTTEFLCRYIHTQMSQKARAFFQGTLKITLNESHVAWASYQAPVAPTTLP